MDFKSKSRTHQILMVMRILAWVAFFGLSIEAGAILFNYVISLFNAEASANFYRGMDLLALREFSLSHYTTFISFLIAIVMMKAHVSYLLIKALGHVNLMNPFKIGVVKILEKISYVLLTTWVVGMIHNGYIAWLLQQTGVPTGEWVSGEFVFVAGLVFVISQIFKRGVEIQSENELTV
jgi:hypothetical protein